MWHRIILRDRLRREPEHDQVQDAVTAAAGRNGSRGRGGRPSMGTNEGVVISAFEDGNEVSFIIRCLIISFSA